MLIVIIGPFKPLHAEACLQPAVCLAWAHFVLAFPLFGTLTLSLFCSLRLQLCIHAMDGLDLNVGPVLEPQTTAAYWLAVPAICVLRLFLRYGLNLTLK
jgi:hypothetical protein